MVRTQLGIWSTSKNVLIALSCFGLAACGATSGQAPPPAPSPVPSNPLPAHYVFLMDGEVVLGKGSGIVKRFKADLGSYLDRDNFAWTPSGRFFVWFEGDDFVAESRVLKVLDVESVAVNDVRCPDCSSVAASGPNQVMIGRNALPILDTAETSDSVLRLDLDKDRPPTLLKTEIPKFDMSMRVIGGSDGLVLMAGANTDEVSASGGGPEHLVLLSQNGTSRDAGLSQGNSAVSMVATGTGKSAIVSGTRGGWCNTADSISIVDHASGTISLTDTVAVINILDPSGLSSGFAAHDIWWDADGTLMAAFESWRCDDSAAGVDQLVRPSVWALRGDLWVRVENTPLLSKRTIGGAELRLLPESQEAYDPFTGRAGRLTAVSDGEEQEISAGVRIVLTPPVRE